ncbi:NHL domain-containing protein [Actinoplanes sp. NPDC004185]
MNRAARALAAGVIAVATVGTPQAALAESAAATVYAGTGSAGYAGDGGPATAATLNKPGGIAAGPDGVVYVADTANGVVRAISSDGVIRTVAGRGGSAQKPQDTPVPANAQVPGSDVTLRNPAGLAVNATGTVYIGDSGNNRILSLSANRDVSLVAGGNGAGFSGDGGPAIDAQLRDVSGIDIDDAGALVFGDLRNYRVRRIGSDGVITTLIGSGDVGLLAGGEAKSFTFPYAPISTAVGGGSDRWVASTLLYALSGTQMRAVVRDGDGRWSYSDNQSATIPPGGWQGNLYVAATKNAVYLSADDGLYRFYPDGRVETLLAKPSIVGPLTMVDDQTGYLADARGNKVYKLQLNGLSSDESAGGSEWWRQWWTVALAIVIVLALVAAVAVTVARRRRA